MVTRRSICAAMSMLWVAMMAASPGGAHQLIERGEDVVGGVDVEIAGRLVGEQDARRIGDRARDGDALLLAARKLRRPVRQPVLEPQIAQQLGAALARFAARQAADHLRQDDVLQRGEFRQQMMELIDEADLGAPDPRARDIGQLRGGAPSI